MSKWSSFPWNSTLNTYIVGNLRQIHFYLAQVWYCEDWIIFNVTTIRIRWHLWALVVEVEVVEEGSVFIAPLRFDRKAESWTEFGPSLALTAEMTRNKESSLYSYPTRIYSREMQETKQKEEDMNREKKKRKRNRGKEKKRVPNYVWCTATTVRSLSSLRVSGRHE